MLKKVCLRGLALTSKQQNLRALQALNLSNNKTLLFAQQVSNCSVIINVSRDACSPLPMRSTTSRSITVPQKKKLKLLLKDTLKLPQRLICRSRRRLCTMLPTLDPTTRKISTKACSMISASVM